MAVFARASPAFSRADKGASSLQSQAATMRLFFAGTALASGAWFYYLAEREAGASVPRAPGDGVSGEEEEDRGGLAVWGVVAELKDLGLGAGEPPPVLLLFAADIATRDGAFLRDLVAFAEDEDLGNPVVIMALFPKRAQLALGGGTGASVVASAVGGLPLHLRPGAAEQAAAVEAWDEAVRSFLSSATALSLAFPMPLHGAILDSVADSCTVHLAFR